MNRSVIRNLVVVALIAYPAFAFGQDQAPDVKGKWIGKTHTILVGKGGHWPKGRGTWDKPALLEKDLAFDIRGQDGRRRPVCGLRAQRCRTPIARFAKLSRSAITVMM